MSTASRAASRLKSILDQIERLQSDLHCSDDTDLVFDVSTQLGIAQEHIRRAHREADRASAQDSIDWNATIAAIQP